MQSEEELLQAEGVAGSLSLKVVLRNGEIMMFPENRPWWNWLSRLSLTWGSLWTVWNGLVWGGEFSGCVLFQT